MRDYIRHLFTASRNGSEDVRKKHILNMIILGVITGLALLGWHILRRWFFKEFNPFFYWDINGNFWLNLRATMLPLAIYAISIGQLDWFCDDKFEEDTLASENMAFKGVVSLFAGVFEELLHRGVLIYYGLIAIYLMNLTFNWLALIGLLILYLVIIAAVKPSLFISLLFLVLFIGGWLLLKKISMNNPIHLLNGFILGIYHWVSLGAWRVRIILGVLMAVFLAIHARNKLEEKGRLGEGPIFFVLLTVFFAIWAGYAFPKGTQTLIHLPIIPSGADKWTTLLFIGAVMWSNAEFRKGHKYQGLPGVLNSHIFGFYMIYITFTYGLVYAIIAHFLFDILLFWGEHAVRVVKNWRYV